MKRTNKGGVCIYCGVLSESLSREHIIPYALGGTLVLQDASCPLCSEITSAFERDVAGDTYRLLRAKYGFPTRNPNGHPKNISMQVNTDSGPAVIDVAIEEYPIHYPVLHLPEPGILSGAELSELNPEMKLDVIVDQGALDAFLMRHPAIKSIDLSCNIVWGSLCKVLAKIAHSMLVATFGDGAYVPLLPDVILGKDPHLSHYIGGISKDSSQGVVQLHEQMACRVVTLRGCDYAIFDLWVIGGKLPQYSVVAAKVLNYNQFMAGISNGVAGRKRYQRKFKTRFMYNHEWASFVIAFLRNSVASVLPERLGNAPYMNGYKIDAYALPPDHILLTFADTPGEISSGPDGQRTVHPNDYPEIPCSVDGLNIWDVWVRERLKMQKQEFFFIIPVVLRSEAGVAGDYEILSVNDRALLDLQSARLFWWYLENCLLIPTDGRDE